MILDLDPQDRVAQPDRRIRFEQLATGLQSLCAFDTQVFLLALD
jgi:hypothetical protein